MANKNRSSPSPTTPKLMETNGFSLMNEDLLRNILSRLPATSFASAATVSKTWNAACCHILSRPKFSSAISLKPLPLVALQEVFDKVMSEPIRPHFAIASVGPGFEIKDVLQFMVEKVGSRTPIIVSSVKGILGRDALSHEFREVKWIDGNIDEVPVNTGIVLTVGFVPGLKVDVIPLLRQRKAPQGSMTDKFVQDIKSYTSSMSGCTSPQAIIMIGDGSVDQKPILEKLDYAMSMETIIVGDERGQFVYRSSDVSRNVSTNKKHSPDAVALVFARDRNKACGIGNIEFHFALSKGVSAIGPRLKAASVRVQDSYTVTWLTARREGQQEILDGQQMLEDIDNEMENNMDCVDLYIGVTRRRNCSVGSDKPRMMTTLALHGIEGGDSEYLYVDGVGIRTGDYFQFYHSDPKTALSSSRSVSSTLRKLKLDWDSKSSLSKSTIINAVDKKEAFGGFIFSCLGRGESFFGQLNVDSSPFLDNFPGVPVAGTFCGGEIGRGCTSLTANGDEGGSARCHLHAYSTVYLVMSYTPPEH
ncbi:hypothetical protein E1A91_A03G068700v1 [Gossypium mustelinum]|uniref:FIST C-domain domain-containing protein n=3 Tax=Gossypium TaxID=3633 RepID=A0A5J5WBW5_GOSBA|nr:hypothetical protein ES319_A03G064200v1 [Gossypium barbadense]TYH24188.1 hypothetical protein ES288_A03G071500v1 [Gossypium darwinii]TYJ42149.1 hypothetical protein E1A91_A03G068700v1 [Gossypium mustelinum]